MKTMQKRIVVFLLTICMLASAIPFGVFATGETGTQEIFYDFDLRTQDSKIASGKESLELTANQTRVRELYDAGTIQWQYIGKKNGNSAADGSGNEVNNFTRYSYEKGYGIQINSSISYGWWVAFRIKAPGTGTYNLTVNTNTVPSGDVYKHSVWTETYFFDASALTDSVTMDDLLVKQNRINPFAPTSESPDAFVGNVATTEGKEYILVFRQTKETYDAANGDGLRTGNLYLRGLTFAEAVPVEPEKTGYDFDLIGNYPYDFATGTMSVVDQLSDIQEFYKNGYIDWCYYDSGVVTADADGKFTGNSLDKGNGITVSTTGSNWYYAIRFRSPGDGYHQVLVDSYLSARTGADGTIYRHSVWTEAYILDAAALDSGKTTIADSMLKRNKLGEFSPTSVNPDPTIGYYDFEANKEYVLVLRQTKATYTASKEDGLTTLNLYLEGLKFTHTPNYKPPVADNSKVVYDVDLADKNTGIYPKKTGLNDKFDDIHRLYGLGELNWEFAEPVADSYWSFTDNGVTVYTAPDDYVAFRIQSPGSGLYTLRLSHGIFGKGALGAVYVLPADTENIQEAMDTHNRVGMMPFYSKDGVMTDGVVDGNISLVGTWEFGDAKEYIVVVEAYATSAYTSMSYMYISQLICEKGNTISDSEVEKKINSIIVDPAPVKINHSGTVNAVAEINGDDYFFMPQEGRSMSVYNMDTKELVAQVELPFTAARGIAVDEDGYVWVVGSNPNIYRYDPYLDVGESAYYFKVFENNPEDKSGIYEANNAFGLEYANGILYFGVFGVEASFAKYNIATGEFTHMGVYGSEDANSFPSTPVYKDGILYGTLAGDINADGVKTFEVIKIDAETNELLERLDISKHVSQNEVMIRGMGICGDTLLLGGSANDIKSALAVDVSGEKMKVIDIGVQGFINYYSTKEVDGKCYFLASGLGMWEFDGATQTAKRVKGLENATVGFRVSDYVTLSVENNDKFPGISYMGFRGSNNMPTLYNMETGTMMTVDDMILDEHGNGQELRSILNGKGENEIYLGAYRTNNCSVFDTVTGKIVHAYEANSDQTDVMYIYEDKLYAGNYNAAVLTQINLADERRNVPLLSLKSMYGQARIHTITGGDGYIFCGSIADSFNYSGCLAWINLSDLNEKVVILDAVKEQSIISLCYNDGMIFAGSSIYGGSSTIERSDVSAKIVVYDVKTQKKLIEIDPRNYISGLPSQLTGIDAMIADPNIAENGKIWVHMGERLLCLKYNKATNKVTLKEELCFDVNNRGCHDFLPYMPYLDGHYLYVGFGTKGGLRKVNLLDPSDNELIPVPGDKMFTLADDGNIYYCSDNKLCMYPLNVTDADWAEAEKVDQMIAAIGVVTVDSEANIRAVRAAYNALSNKHKALIQNLYDLEAAENDLVEAKIASIGQVTLEDKTLIETIKKEYTALSVKNRSYVKNYRDVYIPALQALGEIVDKTEAEKVQIMINGIKNLGQITLENEEAIKTIRTAYDALTKSQRALVNAKALLDAEAIIKALRMEKVEYLKNLIESIGNVTLEDEPVIDEAVAIYEWLTMDERKFVSYEILMSAKNQLVKLQKEAAANVDALIAQIGDEITMGSNDAIEAARKAYDALTPGSKKLVKSLQHLLDAEAILAELVKQQTTTIIIVVAAVVILAAAAVATVLLLRKKKKAALTVNAEDTAETPAEPEA